MGWERQDGRYCETGEARQARQGIRYLKYKQVLVEHLKYMSLDVLDHALVDALLMLCSHSRDYVMNKQAQPTGPAVTIDQI
jgi:hypothetical protein